MCRIGKIKGIHVCEITPFLWNDYQFFFCVNTLLKMILPHEGITQFTNSPYFADVPLPCRTVLMSILFIEAEY